MLHIWYMWFWWLNLVWKSVCVWMNIVKDVLYCTMMNENITHSDGWHCSHYLSSSIVNRFLSLEMFCVSASHRLRASMRCLFIHGTISCLRIMKSEGISWTPGSLIYDVSVTCTALLAQMGIYFRTKIYGKGTIQYLWLGGVEDL